jgi:nicotinamide riboside kinase
VTRIAAGQVESEDRLAREANRVLFCDTDLLTTQVYSEVFFGACPEAVAAEARRRRYDLYLWLSADVPHVPDAQRRPAHREPAVVERFGSLLREKGSPVVAVGGGWEERFARAVAAVSALLEG